MVTIHHVLGCNTVSCGATVFFTNITTWYIYLKAFYSCKPDPLWIAFSITSVLDTTSDLHRGWLGLACETRNYLCVYTHSAVASILTGIGGAVIVVGFTQSTLKSFRTWAGEAIQLILWLPVHHCYNICCYVMYTIGSVQNAAPEWVVGLKGFGLPLFLAEYKKQFSKGMKKHFKRQGVCVCPPSAHYKLLCLRYM